MYIPYILSIYLWYCNVNKFTWKIDEKAHKLYTNKGYKNRNIRKKHMSNNNIVLIENTHDVQVVGKLKQEIIDALNISLPCADILMYPGAIKHMKKRPDHFAKYFHRIPEIIKSPDYIGINPTEPDSVELIKDFGNNVLVAIKLDPKGYLYLSSMYELTPQKVPKRLASGRIQSFNP